MPDDANPGDPAPTDVPTAEPSAAPQPARPAGAVSAAAGSGLKHLAPEQLEASLGQALRALVGGPVAVAVARMEFPPPDPEMATDALDITLRVRTPRPGALTPHEGTRLGSAWSSEWVPFPDRLPGAS